MIIEGTMFSILIAAYFYVRLRMDVWPPPGDQFPHVILPTIALVPLILSAIRIVLGEPGRQEEQPRRHDRRLGS